MEASTAPRPPPEPFYTLRPRGGDVTTADYVNLGSTGSGLVSGTSSGQLTLWRLSDKRQAWSTACEAGVISVSAIKACPDSLSVQLRGGVVCLWSLETGKCTSSMSINNPSFCKLSHITPSSPKGGAFGPECFAVADSNYGTVNVYDYKTQQLAHTLTADNPKSRGMCMCVSAWCDSSSGVPLVLAGFDDGSLLVWDARQASSELASLKLYTEPVMCVGLDKERVSGVCGSPGNSLEAFSLSLTEGLIKKKLSIEIKNCGVATVAVRHDSKIMASGGWDGRVRVFGWKKGKPLAILNYHSAVVHCVGFAGEQAQAIDTNLMFCGSKDNRISLWKIY